MRTAFAKRRSVQLVATGVVAFALGVGVTEEAAPAPGPSTVTGPSQSELDDATAENASLRSRLEAAEDEAVAAVHEVRDQAAGAQRRAVRAAKVLVREQAKVSQRAAVSAAIARTRARSAASAASSAPGASTDPRFSYCYEANDAGYGSYRRGVDPEYDWYDDNDGDGVVCES